MIRLGISSGKVATFTRKYWVRARDTEGNLSPKPGEAVSVRLTSPTILATRFTLSMVLDTAAPKACLDTVAFALDVTSSPDSSVRIQWQAKGYYHDSAGVDEKGGVGPNGAVGISTGAPHQDTLFLTRGTLDGLGAAGSRIGWDSVYVSAMVIGKTGNLLGATAPAVRIDSLGCFHPSPAAK
jgi:hypothetical protein